MNNRPQTSKLGKQGQVSHNQIFDFQESDLCWSITRQKQWYYFASNSCFSHKRDCKSEASYFNSSKIPINELTKSNITSKRKFEFPNILIWCSFLKNYWVKCNLKVLPNSLLRIVWRYFNYHYIYFCWRPIDVAFLWDTVFVSRPISISWSLFLLWLANNFLSLRFQTLSPIYFLDAFPWSLIPTSPFSIL